MARPNHPTVFISACERSADMHAAALIRAVRQAHPHVRFAGLAGPLMQQAGCIPIDDLTRRSAMLLGVVGTAAHAARAAGRILRLLRRQTFAAAVLIDSPTLHLPLAKSCNARRVPVMYYIAPQTWAWGTFRLAKIRRRVDRLACILPFEPSYFRQHGIDATYVGHPLFDTLANQPVDPQRVRQLRAGAQPVLALFPGSRRHVIREVLPGQLAVARSVRRRFPAARFLISAADAPAARLIHAHLAAAKFDAHVDQQHRPETIPAADLALVASGTTTLEVAYHGTPMIVMYNASRWAYRLLGRWFIHTRHLSLINVLADREVVPEFMPYYQSPEPIAQQAIELLLHPQRRARMRAELQEVIAPLARPGASQAAAEILLDLLQARPRKT